MKADLLTNRLEIVANAVTQNDTVADIGCDHGKLTVYLSLYKNVFVYAVDIKENPLNKTRQLVNKFALKDKVTILKQDGIGTLCKKVNTVIIAGLGGDTIVKILSDKKIVYQMGFKLILQPQSKIENVRKFLYSNGFKITDETSTKDKGKFYIILCASYEGEIKKPDKFDTLFGEFKWMNKREGSSYANHLQKKYQKVIESLKKSKGNETKIKDIKLLIKKLEENINDKSN